MNLVAAEAHNSMNSPPPEVLHRLRKSKTLDFLASEGSSVEVNREATVGKGHDPFGWVVCAYVEKEQEIHSDDCARVSPTQFQIVHGRQIQASVPIQAVHAQFDAVWSEESALIELGPPEEAGGRCSVNRRMATQATRGNETKTKDRTQRIGSRIPPQ